MNHYHEHPRTAIMLPELRQVALRIIFEDAIESFYVCHKNHYCNQVFFIFCCDVCLCVCVCVLWFADLSCPALSIHLLIYLVIIYPLIC